MLPEILYRPRLLEGRLPLAAITVIRGPGGAGKTVLLSQLIAESAKACGGWITVEEETSSRSAFWRLVLGRTLGEASAVRAVGEEFIDAERIVHALASAGHPLIIVIDDAHLVTEPRVFVDILAVARAVPTVSFLLATRRTIPVLEEPSEALSLDIQVVLPEDMQFTASEIAAFAGVPVARANEFHRITDGNALLLRALQLGVARHTDGDAVAGAVDVLKGYLRRYQHSVGEHLKTFMQRTSLGDDFSQAEAKDVTGFKSVVPLLGKLEAAGLLTRKGSGEDARFRYHPLVRDVLRADLTAARLDDIGELHGIVARHRAQRGDEEGALRHALLARDFGFATRMLLLGGTDLLRATPYEFFAKVPLRVAAHHPLLAAGRALKENARGERWVSQEFFVAAVVASRSLALRNTPERASMAVLESVSARLQGRNKDALSAANRAMGLINRLGSDSVLGDQVYQLMSMCAVSFFRAGNREGLRRVLARVPTENLRGGLVCAALAAVDAAVAGDWRELASVEKTIERAGWQQQELLGYRGALLQLALMLRDLANADTESVYRRIRAFGDHLPTLEFRPLFAATEALAALIDGEPDNANLIIAELRRSEKAVQRLSTKDADLLTLVDALAAVAAGRTRVARAHLASVRPTFRWARLLRAHLSLLQGDHLAAARDLGVAGESGVSEPRLARAGFLLRAWLGLEAGETDAATSALLRAGSIAEVQGEDGSLMLIPNSVRHRLSRLLDADDSPAATIVHAQLIAPLPSPFTVVPPVPRLSKRELIVLAQLHSHASNSEIAASLDISPNTVKTQLRSAYRKLGAANRSQALVRMAVLGVGLGAAETSEQRDEVGFA